MDAIVTSAVTARPYPLADEASGAGISWGAVIGGAFTAAALALVLLLLGLGLGFSSISPWSPAGARSSAIGTATIVWLIVTQAIASAMGGYLAGRLRTKWVRIHSDEVYFRDTAHGFLTWAVGLVMTAAFLTSAAMSILGGGAAAAGVATTSVATTSVATTRGPVAGNRSALGAATMAQEIPTRQGETGSTPGATEYYVDALFRSDHAMADGGNPSRAEVGRILAQGARKGELSAQDRAYVAQVVAAQTGLSAADADKRVNDVLAQAKTAVADAEAAARDAVDAARRAAAKTSLWLFVALLIGAFCASLAATIGGRQRDQVLVALGPEATANH